MPSSAHPDQETPPRDKGEPAADRPAAPAEAEGPSLSWARILLLAPVAPLLMLVHTLWARRRGLLIAIGVSLLWYYLVHQPAVRARAQAEQQERPAATVRTVDAGR